MLNRTWRKATSAWAVLALLLGLTVITGAGPAAAAGAPAVIRAAHFSPDTPGVDVYLTAFSGGTSVLWVGDVTYGGVSPYRSVEPGLYVVAMRAHGAASSSPPVVSWNLDVKAGQAYTAAAIGSNKALKTIVLHDDLSTPPAGSGRVRLVQASSRTPTADVIAVGGPDVALRAAFATTTGYTNVPSGVWPLRAAGSGSGVPETTADLTVQAGTVTTLLLLDGKTGGITLRAVVDSAAPGTTPVGSVPAGEGGTAPRHSTNSAWQGAAAGAGAVVVALLISVLLVSVLLALVLLAFAPASVLRPAPVAGVAPSGSSRRGTGGVGSGRHRPA